MLTNDDIEILTSRKRDEDEEENTNTGNEEIVREGQEEERVLKHSKLKVLSKKLH